ncbi:MAG TPA: hypothetical protein DCW72_03440, partial [Elusimicrobia bacterium]|nr:hypothetical protein [Elusimicrobiota bacterium]
MREYSKVNYKKIPLWKNVAESDWNDYQWQLRNVIKDIPTLEKVAVLTAREKADLKACLKKFTMD